MPKHYKPQLTETATPMLEVWERMQDGLLLHARTILSELGFYAERDIQEPDIEIGRDLSPEEQQEANPIIRGLVEAVQRGEAMPDHILLSTLRKIGRLPSLFFADNSSADAQYMIASRYRRALEKPATYCLDILGDAQINSPYPLEVPTEINISRAAVCASSRLASAGSRGRPAHAANRVIAEHMAPIFRSSGRPIVRGHKPDMARGRVISVEAGQFSISELSAGAP